MPCALPWDKTQTRNSLGMLVLTRRRRVVCAGSGCADDGGAGERHNELPACRQHQANDVACLHIAFSQKVRDAVRSMVELSEGDEAGGLFGGNLEFQSTWDAGLMRFGWFQERFSQSVKPRLRRCLRLGSEICKPIRPG